MSQRIDHRHESIIHLLEEHGELHVDALSETLKASEATIRRDLATLEHQGYLARTFGGARPLNRTSLVLSTFEEKRQRMRKEKERVARKALSCVEPGMTLVLDSGTTTWRVGAGLKDITPLTVFTTALAIIEELGPEPDISLFCTGGQFRLENLDFVGPSACSKLDLLRADIAFISGDSLIPGRGLYARDEAGAEIGRAICNCADRIIVVLDHSKINPGGRHQIIDHNEIDLVITDSGIDPHTKQALQDEPFQLWTA